MSRLSPEALDAFAAVVGRENVDASAETLARYARSTGPVSTSPAGVVRPASTEEVQDVVRAAARHGVALHPISGGRNWGYTDALGVLDGQVILDLRRMTRIVEIDTELAYATVEPGVTQAQLEEALRLRGGDLWLDATGAGPDASIVGNVLERGFGHTRYGDRYLNACGFEVVLADGRLLKTGFGHFRGAHATPVHKWGTGPMLEGLFTQSSFGVVTRMTVWLVPRPPAFSAFFFMLDDDAALGPLVDALRRLRLQGTLETPVHVGNDLRVLAMRDAYPWDEMRGAAPLSAEMRASLRRRHGIDRWSGSGALYGTSAEVRAARRAVARELKRIDGLKRLFFVDDRRLGVIAGAARTARRTPLGPVASSLYDRLAIAYDLLRGHAAPELLQGALWRARAESPSLDPLERHAGLLWLAPVLPATSQHVAEVNALLEPIFAAHGFDYMVTLSFVTARAICATTTVAFDRDDPEECERARRCYETAFDAAVAAGYPPYRAANLGMARLDAGSDVFFDVAASLKAALDPAGILSPGRYDPATARRAHR